MPITSIYTCSDEYIKPWQTSVIEGATNIGLCDEFVGHFQTFYDPEIYLIMHGALTKPTGFEPVEPEPVEPEPVEPEPVEPTPVEPTPGEGGDEAPVEQDAELPQEDQLALGEAVAPDPAGPTDEAASTPYQGNEWMAFQADPKNPAAGCTKSGRSTGSGAAGLTLLALAMLLIGRAGRRRSSLG